jgi:hypothetical protein
MVDVAEVAGEKGMHSKSRRIAINMGSKDKRKCWPDSQPP